MPGCSQSDLPVKLHVIVTQQVITEQHLIRIFLTILGSLIVDAKQYPILSLYFYKILKKSKYSAFLFVQQQSFFWSHSGAVGFEDGSWAFELRSEKSFGYSINSINPFALFQDNQTGNFHCWPCRSLCLPRWCTWNFEGLGNTHTCWLDCGLVYHSYCLQFQEIMI